MTKKKLTKSTTKSYSPLEKRKIVEEIGRASIARICNYCRKNLLYGAGSCKLANRECKLDCVSRYR